MDRRKKAVPVEKFQFNWDRKCWAPAGCGAVPSAMGDTGMNKTLIELTYLMSVLPPHPQMVSSMSAGGGFSFGMIFLPWYYKPWKTSWLSGWELFLSSPCLKGIWNSFMSPFTIYYYLPTSLKAQRAGLAHMASWWLIVLQNEKVGLWRAHRLEACGGACYGWC